MKCNYSIVVVHSNVHSTQHYFLYTMKESTSIYYLDIRRFKRIHTGCKGW